MLTYVFWHWPRATVAGSDYETALLRFYKALKRERPAGLLDCFGFRLQNLPWSDGGANGYEDWYLVEDFAALGSLNEGAVSGVAKKPHDEVASLAGGGAGGIYRRIGEVDVGRIRWSTWFAKPAGVSYGQLKDLLRSMKVGGYWQRQMVLGPAPEFCVQGKEPLVLPIEYQSIKVEITPLG